MLRALRRAGDSSNTVIGVILLIMLLVFVGPNVLPGLLARTFPFVYEGVPCDRLRNAENRAAHQSLIGRAAQNPLVLRVQVTNVPTVPEDTLRLNIIITNNTIGTVPFIFDSAQVIVGDDGSSGVGLLFEPVSGFSTGGVRRTAGVTSFPENFIRLLGPRQRCVHSVSFPGSAALPALATGTLRVRAYYRITSGGTATLAQGSTAPAIFFDQGLAVIPGGLVQSDLVDVALPVLAGG
ncbi:MAG: hypothetical protein MUE40_21900 [Anaerolineae bacterium]|nr:hypothetical protein [Anaerolineae bacterium]